MKHKPLLIVAFYLILSAGNIFQADSTTYLLDNPYTILVNKLHPLTASYEPYSLIMPDVSFLAPGDYNKNYLVPEAANALEKLYVDAQKEGYELVAVSGYRSYNTQKSIYNTNIQIYGEGYASTVSAEPGKSEHQTGLAMDLSSETVHYSLDETFVDTPEGTWLANNCYEYGFIIRYPQGKEAITGYAYEPWHIRYVGIPLATYLYKNDLTLEEFLLQSTS